MKNASELVKKTEEDLQENNNLLQSIIGETTDTIFVKDLSGRYLMMNSAGADIIGKSIEEIIGKDDTQLFPHNIARNLMEEDKKIIASGKYIAFDEKVPKSGKIHFFHTVKVPYRNYRGNIIGVIGIARDITERKYMAERLQKSEKILAKAQEIAHLGSWEWDVVKNESFCSDELYRMHGLKPQQYNITYEKFIDLVHPDDREFVKKSVNAALYERIPYNIDFRVVLKDGIERIIHSEAEVVYGENGEPLKMLGTEQDVTERKKAEETLQEQKRALEQKNIALNEILGQIELEKKQIKDNVITNAENLLLPIIQKLRLTGESRKYVQLLRKNLMELTSSFGARITEKEAKLTSREIEICNMVRNGLTSKEIASLLNISFLTIEKHRINIRRKLGIINKDINLTSFLNTL